MKVLTRRRFSHEGTEYQAGAVIEVTAGQFADWKAAGLVKQAPEKELKDKPAKSVG